MKTEKKNLRRISIVVTAQTKGNGRHLCMRKVIRERVQLTDFCSHAVLIVRGENESR